MTRDLARSDVAAVIADLAGVLLKLEPAQVAAIDARTRLVPDGLGVDSLALLELAAAVATFFRLHESEIEDELLRRRSVGAWTDIVLQGWALGRRRLTFVTSGSTGPPVPHRHTWAMLAQELDAHAEIFAGRRRVVGLVGPRHIYGFLFCALLPRWLGVPYVDARTAAPAGLASATRSGDLVVGFPLRWDLALAGGPWPADVVGVTSTGPIAATTVDALRQHGLARMVEVYGSSETGGVAWRDAPTDALRPYPHWSLRHDGKLLRSDPEEPGRTHVFEAPDVLAARGTGFDVTGRRDGTVKVAGTSVCCAHVAAVLGEHAAVRACAVRPMRIAEGSRLKAYVVLHDAVTAEAALPALRAWILARLSAPEAPASLVVGAAVPRDAHGKLTDWPVQGRLADVA